MIDANAPLFSYNFELNCPRCGDPLVHRASGTSTGLETRSVAHCERCRDDWLIEVKISSKRAMAARATSLPAIPPPRPELCGTSRGVQLHRARAELLDEPCLLFERSRKSHVDSAHADGDGGGVIAAQGS